MRRIISDPRVLAGIARTEERFVLIHDSDFGRLTLARGFGVYGVLFGLDASDDRRLGPRKAAHPSALNDAGTTGPRRTLATTRW